MTDKRQVFIAIFSSGCSHCVHFKKEQLSDLKDYLDNDVKDVFRYVIVEDGSSSSDIPAALSPYTKMWYPLFLVVDGQEWNSSLKDDEIKTLTRVKVMNAVYDADKGKWVYKGEYPFTADGVEAWLNSFVKPKEEKRLIPSAKKLAELRE